MTVLRASVPAVMGDRATLECIVEANPRPIGYWTLPNNSNCKCQMLLFPRLCPAVGAMLIFNAASRRRRGARRDRGGLPASARVRATDCEFPEVFPASCRGTKSSPARLARPLVSLRVRMSYVRAGDSLTVVTDSREARRPFFFIGDSGRDDANRSSSCLERHSVTAVDLPIDSTDCLLWKEGPYWIDSCF